MYDVVETGSSSEYLERIVKDRPVDLCLIGGWAVFHTVNQRFLASTGRTYLGSKDIDIGIHDVGSLKKVERYLEEEMDFERLSFRFVKYLDRETGRPIPSDLARTTPLHFLFELYFDIMLPVCPEDIRRTAGFIPPDEPILTKVFEDNDGKRTIQLNTGPVDVPAPFLLLAMKLNSVGTRTKDHKRIKDLCDIVALVLFSGMERDEIIGMGRNEATPENISGLSSDMFEKDFEQASTIIGLPRDAVASLIDMVMTDN